MRLGEILMQRSCSNRKTWIGRWSAEGARRQAGENSHRPRASRFERPALRAGRTSWGSLVTVDQPRRRRRKSTASPHGSCGSAASSLPLRRFDALDSHGGPAPISRPSRRCGLLWSEDLHRTGAGAGDPDAIDKFYGARRKSRPSTRRSSRRKPGRIWNICAIMASEAPSTGWSTP